MWYTIGGICLPTTPRWVPWWYMPPYYTSLGTPLVYTVHLVLPGTLTPVFSDPVRDSLGSTLRIVRDMRRIQASLLLRCEEWKRVLRRVAPVLPEESVERLDRRRVTLGKSGIKQGCCARWVTLPAIRSLLGMMRRVVFVRHGNYTFCQECED